MTVPEQPSQQTVRDLFDESFYNWLLLNGVDPIVSDEFRFSSASRNPINADVDMPKLKAAINAHIVSVLVSIKRPLAEANFGMHGTKECNSCSAIEALDAAIAEYKEKV